MNRAASLGPPSRCFAGDFLCRNVNQDHAVGWDETLARDCIQLVEVNAIELAQHLVDVVWIVEECPAFRQPVGASTEPAGELQTVHEIEALLRSRAIELRLREARRPRQLGEERAL